MNQRTAVLVDHNAQKPFCRDLSQRRVFVHVTDDLSAQEPQVALMGFYSTRRR
jgi:hypothetical protein